LNKAQVKVTDVSNVLMLLLKWHCRYSITC